MAVFFCLSISHTQVTVEYVIKKDRLTPDKYITRIPFENIIPYTNVILLCEYKLQEALI